MIWGCPKPESPTHTCCTHGGHDRPFPAKIFRGSETYASHGVICDTSNCTFMAPLAQRVMIEVERSYSFPSRHLVIIDRQKILPGRASQGHVVSVSTVVLNRPTGGNLEDDAATEILGLNHHPLPAANVEPSMKKSVR